MGWLYHTYLQRGSFCFYHASPPAQSLHCAPRCIHTTLLQEQASDEGIAIGHSHPSPAATPVLLRALAGGRTHTILVPSDTTVDELRTLAAAIIYGHAAAPPPASDAAAAAAAARARRLPLTSGGRALRPGAATLADAGRPARAGVEVRPPLAGGGGGRDGEEARSVGREGIDAMLRELAGMAQATADGRRMTRGGARMSAHALRCVLLDAVEQARFRIIIYIE